MPSLIQWKQNQCKRRKQPLNRDFAFCNVQSLPQLVSMWFIFLRMTRFLHSKKTFICVMALVFQTKIVFQTNTYTTLPSLMHSGNIYIYIISSRLICYPVLVKNAYTYIKIDRYIHQCRCVSITKKYSSYEFLLLYLFLYHRTNKDISIVLKEALLLFQIFSACFHDLQLKRKSYLRAANMSKFQLCFEDFIRNILFPVIYKIQQIPPFSAISKLL